MPLEESDLNQIQELINKNNENLISKQLPEIIKTSNAQFQEIVTNQIGGATKRMVDNINRIREEIPQQQTIIDAVKASFQPQSNNNSGENNNNSNEENASGGNDERYQELLKQMQNQATAMEDLTKTVQNERDRREKAEHLAAQEKIYGSFISSVSDKVVDPRNFLRTLIEGKKIQEKDGALVVPIQGKVDFEGNQAYEPAINHIDDFLKTDYSYFAKARQGNGSGSSPGEPYQQKTTPKFFKQEINSEAGKLDATDLVQAFREGKAEQIFNEAKNL